MCEGIADELRGIDLGDKRLNKRSVRVIEALAANPEASINASCENWSETQAAYRFFDNDAVAHEQVLQPHIEATKGRMREQPVALIAPDTSLFIVSNTTELDFMGSSAEGCTVFEYRGATRLVRASSFGSHARQITTGRRGSGVL